MATNKRRRSGPKAKASEAKFKRTAFVEVERDQKGISELQHIFKPFTDMRAKEQGSLAQAYVKAVARVYQLPSSHLKELRLAHEAVMGTTHIFSFSQTRFNLPIWEAGITVIVTSAPLSVISSYQSMHKNVGYIKRPDQSSPFTPHNAKRDAWPHVLNLSKAQAKQFKANETRLLIYRYDPAQRWAIEGKPNGDPPSHFPCAPSLPLPPVPPIIVSGAHYVVTELLFALPVEGIGPVNWRAFVEVNTGAVLYLRAFIACALATGKVFLTDPVTSGGLPPARVNLVGIPEPMPPAKWHLDGEYVQLVEDSPPDFPPPTSTSGVFDLPVDTQDFAAVSAYYHCDSFFRMMESMGFNIRTYFADTQFPIKVDHWALNNSVDAVTVGNRNSRGCAGFRFGRTTYAGPTGIAADARMVAHEFCHALLLNRIWAMNFGFAHSAGDALAAILYDPGSVAARRELTFPWLATYDGRQHLRTVADDWLWGGRRDANDTTGYTREQILSTTLFHLYLVLGGELTTDVQLQKAAARKVVYLIIYGIGLLGPSTITATPKPDPFATDLMNADAVAPALDNVPGGCVHKVVRWCFEKQGLYQPPERETPYTEPGVPPAIDVFIDDGRIGDYEPYLRDFFNAPGIWNQLSPIPHNPPRHEAPAMGKPNYLFVRVQNRGTQPAKSAVVSVYRCIGSSMVWPADWQALLTSPIRVPQSIPSGGSEIAGPFQWTPRKSVALFMAAVSAKGDLSNCDEESPLPCAQGPTPIAQLVPFDNNIALRKMASGNPPKPPRNLRVVS